MHPRPILLCGNVFGAGVLISALGNSDLQWQNTLNYTVGTDIAMFDNRLNVTVDVFRKITDPLLAVITTPGSVGVKSVAMNAGQQNTNGLEATLRVSPIHNVEKGIQWTVSLNARTYKSEYANIGNSLSALNKAGQASVTGTTRYYDGGSPTAIWAVRSHMESAVQLQQRVCFHRAAAGTGLRRAGCSRGAGRRALCRRQRSGTGRPDCGRHQK